jgi:predicted ATPase
MIPRIVITGAPASGKTEFLNRLKGHPDFTDFLFLDELARQLLMEHPDYRQNWRRFHVELYRRQVMREEQAGARPFVTDRGTADAFAFHPEAMVDVGTTLEKEHRRYSAVVQLETSAVLGKQYYRKDSIRSESTDETLKIEQAITKVWRRHPAYHFVRAEIDFEKKFRTFLQLMLRLVRTEG